MEIQYNNICMHCITSGFDIVRVSELAGAKLSAGNPNLVDISDENRPTKLAERYSELYDNAWTDAFGVLIDSGYDDTKAIDILLNFLKVS